MKMKVSTLALMLALSGGAMALVACTEESTAPPPADSGNACSGDLCATSDALRNECEEFLNTCIAAAPNDQDCVGAAILMCQGL